MAFGHKDSFVLSVPVKTQALYEDAYSIPSGYEVPRGVEIPENRYTPDYQVKVDSGYSETTSFTSYTAPPATKVLEKYTEDYIPPVLVVPPVAEEKTNIEKPESVEQDVFTDNTLANLDPQAPEIPENTDSAIIAPIITNDRSMDPFDSVDCMVKERIETGDGKKTTLPAPFNFVENNFNKITTIEKLLPQVVAVDMPRDQKVASLIEGNKFVDKTIHYRFYAKKGIPYYYKQAIRAGLRKWENISSLKFVELSGKERCGKAHIEFGFDEITENGIGADGNVMECCGGITRGIRYSNIMQLAKKKPEGFYQAIVTINSKNFPDAESFAIGTHGFETILHEIGHALGLKHPGNYWDYEKNNKGPVLDKSYDSTFVSVMSYKAGGRNPTENPMSLDKLAIQHLYGI